MADGILIMLPSIVQPSKEATEKYSYVSKAAILGTSNYKPETPS